MLMKFIRCMTWVGAITCLAGSVHAQDDWPTVGDLLNHGEPIPEAELVELLDGKAAIHVLQINTMLAGRIFSCQGANSSSFGFIPPSSFDAVNGGNEPCDIEDSSICFSDPDGRFCIAVRRMPGYGLLFAGLQPESLKLNGEQTDRVSGDPAQVLGIVPTTPQQLASAAGEIDFGPVAFSLPTTHRFTLREGSGFPLSLVFGEGSEGGFLVSAEILGWPDPTSLRFVPREPESEDQQKFEAQLADWEERFRTRDRAKIHWDDEIRASVYETTWLYLDGGTCIRIREHISGAEKADGPQPTLPEELSFQQICITSSGGAYLLITTILKRPNSLENIDDFEGVSREILNSLRLGFASND